VYLPCNVSCKCHVWFIVIVGEYTSVLSILVVVRKNNDVEAALLNKKIEYSVMYMYVATTQVASHLLWHTQQLTTEKKR